MALRGLLVCLGLAFLTAPSRAYTRDELRKLPEAVRFAANIENNFMIGGFKDTLNWTYRHLGKPPENIQQKCTKQSYKGRKVCMSIPMPTPWSYGVDPEAPLPEYPRPQLRREAWLSLNGVWGFKSRGILALGGSWDDEPEKSIIVPFPVEAPLSGIANHDANNVEMLYTRNFTVPSTWRGSRTLLHFDAVDHSATVHLNGKKLGSHFGGYSRFSFDVTDALRDGSNELAVEALDPTDFAHIPCGKQRMRPPRNPSSIWYTSTSGIWQTVWLEPVPKAYIEGLTLVPDVGAKKLGLTVRGSRAAAGSAFRAAVRASGRVVAEASGTVGKPLNITLEDPKLWSPERPFLYDLDVRLEDAAPPPGKDSARTGAPARALAALSVPGFLDKWFGGGGGGDAVASYFGMRSSHLGRGTDGALRPLLNGEFVFQTGMLDQGFWPDGLYTPASDDALIFDLELTKELGFNMLRKHTKVESDRWYYHADRLGILVWQDMPSMFFQMGPQDLSVRDKAHYRAELKEMMHQHFNSPSIVAWVIFNEGWGQHDTVDVVNYAKGLDDTRIFDAASGWTDMPVGDFIDKHDYVGPSAFTPTDTRASVLGEFGGLGLRIEGHMWIPPDSFAYELQTSMLQLQGRFVGLLEQVEALMVDPQYHLSAAVYTELADVEAEINGWVTYDRQVKKASDPKAFRAANERLIARSRGALRPAQAPALRAPHERSRVAGKAKLKKGFGKAKARVAPGT